VSGVWCLVSLVGFSKLTITKSSFETPAQAPNLVVLEFGLTDESGCTDVASKVQLEGMKTITIDQTQYDLAANLYSVSANHFGCELKLGGVFVYMDNQDGARLLTRNVGGSKPSFTATRKTADDAHLVTWSVSNRLYCSSYVRHDAK
jgi:hypothetical protein